MGSRRMPKWEITVRHGILKIRNSNTKMGSVFLNATIEGKSCITFPVALMISVTYRTSFLTLCLLELMTKGIIKMLFGIKWGGGSVIAL